MTFNEPIIDAIIASDMHDRSGAERSSWESLPHALPGARPASPCRKRRVKPAPVRRARGERKRRQYHPVPFDEVCRSLSGHAPPNQAELTPVPRVRLGSLAEGRRHRPPTKRAAILEDADLARVLEHLERNSRSFESDRVKVLLSCKAGLRVGEIAQLSMLAVITPSRKIGDTFEVNKAISKSTKTRVVPINRELRPALEALQRRYPEATHVAFTIGKNGSLRQQSPAALANWFARLYRDVGLVGCSSHSGRRTFATRYLRRGGNIKDLQKLLGHEEITSTECYLELSTNVAELVNCI